MRERSTGTIQSGGGRLRDVVRRGAQSLRPLRGAGGDPILGLIHRLARLGRRARHRLSGLWRRIRAFNSGDTHPLLDATLAWLMALVIVALAVGGLWARRNTQHAESALRAQQAADLASRQVADWLTHRQAALVGVGAIGQGFTQMADQTYLRSALPEAVAIGWWDHAGRDGGVLGNARHEDVWILNVLAAQPFAPRLGVRRMLIELPNGHAGVLFVVPEPQGNSPWQTVVGAAFDLEEVLPHLIAAVPALSEPTVEVRSTAGKLLFKSGAVLGPDALRGTAASRTGSGFEWRIDAMLPPVTGLWPADNAELGLLGIVVGVAMLFGLTATRLGRQRHRTMVALRENATAAARQRRALEASSDAVLIMDDTGCIQWCNGAAEAMLRLPAEQLEGQQWSRFLPGELGTEHWNDLGTTPWPPRNLSPGQVGAWEARRADGSTFPAEVLITAYRGPEPDGRTVVTAFVRDITKRQQLEQRTRQAERLEALGRLAGAVAHDFNNILTVIGSRVQLLGGKGLTARRRAANLEKLETACDAAEGLVEQLLAVARERPGPPRPVDLNGCVERLASLLDTAQCEHVGLKLDLQKEIPPVLGDSGQLGQVVMNLCVNAAEATPAGGTVTIRSRYDLERQRIVLEVADTGTGVPPENLPRIFEPFFTTKGEEGGTGLGLATVYGIVQAHGGEVTVESTPGDGTTFTVWLPRLEKSGDGVALRAPLPPAAFQRATGGD